MEHERQIEVLKAVLQEYVAFYGPTLKARSYFAEYRELVMPSEPAAVSLRLVRKYH